MSGKTPVAIVGMGCQFPQAPDLPTYWHNIRTGKVCFSDVPAERWNHSLYYHPSPREIDKSYARRCGFLDDIRSFAALHYGLSPLRVKVMDPQHRLLLEAVRATLSDAGYENRAFPRERTGVYIGASVSEHKDLLTARLRAQQLFDGAFGRVPNLPAEYRAAAVEDVAPVRAFSMPGNLLNMMAATVANVFDLRGPAFSLDAACSSALVATYEAILHLRAGECDAALAGGVYLNLTPDNLVGFSRIGAISHSDQCRPFDASADGFVLGEGVGVVMLKRLDDAMRDGDRIYAVIRGAGLNNDGHSEGPMTPRQGGQLDALHRAYADCEVTPDTVGFIEAHGTATGVGDVVEVAALKECFDHYREGPINAVLSSVKANVGHTMSAAGAAGLIKAAMVLREQTIPPQAAFERIHPSLNLSFGEGGFRVATREEEWEAPVGHPRRAAVSSFGFGGTNCHLILEEAPARKAPARISARAAAPGWPEPFVISAPNVTLLAEHLSTLREDLGDGEALRASLADLAYTLSTRKREKVAVAFVADSREDLARRLAQARELVLDPSPTSRDGIHFSAEPLPADARKVAFLFPGQGAQNVGLAESLYRRFDSFRARLDALAGPELLSRLYPKAPFDAAKAAEALTKTEVCQPVMAALGLALGDLAKSLGVEPAMTMGHSLGEFAALAASGALEPKATVQFVAERGRLMGNLPGDHGAMVAVAADRAAVQKYVELEPGVVLANINHPKQVVASGTTAGVESLIRRLTEAGITVTRLSVSHAFHSPVVAPAGSKLESVVAGLAWHSPTTSVISCIEPGPYADEGAARRTMVRHATAPVDFAEGVRHAAQAGARVFVQVGAGSALLSMVRSTLAESGAQPTAMVSLAAMDADPDDGAHRLCEALVELAVLGVPVQFEALYEGAAQPVSLPPTPLERESYWLAHREERPQLPPLAAGEESHVKQSVPASEGLVALFREQMAVLQQQNEIIRQQTEALAQGGTARPASLPASVTTVAVPSSAHPVTAAPAVAPVAPVASLPAPAPHPTPAPAAPASVSSAAIEGQVLDIVAKVSAFPRASIRIEQRLLGELGFDSIMAVELSTKLAEAFPGLGGVPKSLFVDTTTLRELVDYVVAQQGPSRGAAPSASAASATASTKEGPVERYSIKWVPRPLSARVPLAEAPFSGPTAIVADRLGVAPLLAKRLAEAGRPATLVGPEALKSAGIHTVIDLRALGGKGDALALAGAELRAPVEAAFRLARDAGREGAPSGFAVAFTGEAAAGLSGLAKSLAREWPSAMLKAIELDVSASPEAMAEAIASELLSGDGTVEVRVQGGKREVAELAVSPVTAPASGLKEGAVVVISGGARGLGSKLALELAKQHHARLALLGRAPASATTAALLTDLAKAGGQAVYLPCDVRQEAQVAAALDDVRKRWGAIDSIVHSAGLIADAPVAKKKDDDFAAVFDTKVAGALSLWRAAAKAPLRRFAIFTSWAGRFGNPSQADYSAANHLAARLAARLGAARPDVQVTALDLPPWEQSAMVQTLSATVREMMRADGVTFLSDAEGLELVHRELSSASASGEVLFGRGLPAAERTAHTSVKLTLGTHPYLGDHRIEGKPVLPLAAAMDYAAQAARQVLHPLPAEQCLTLKDFELLDGVALDGEAIWLHLRATRRGAEARVELLTSATAEGKKTIAYRCRAVGEVGTIATLPLPAGAVEAPTLSLAEFYERHTFHGPLMRGVVGIDDSRAAQVAGRCRSASAGELIAGSASFAVDPLLVDSSFQLAAHWAFTRHGRAGLPLGFAEYRLLAPIAPGSEISCNLSLEKAEGELFIGHIDYRDAQGKLVAQLRGMKAQLRQLAEASTIDPAYYQVESFPQYVELRERIEMAQAMGIENPYFRVHERVTNDTSLMNGREVINFSSYNYVGLSGDPDVNRAVAEAAQRYGTSVSASRVASGEKPIHHELESEIASFLGCEDAVVMVGGHATNVSVIGQLCGPGDLILHDSLAHDSILAGAKLSGASRRAFPHNDWEALEATLKLVRPNVKKVLIAVEGTYSMDGDIPPLPQIIEIKKRYKAMLLVDEAHSLGVLGKTGRGVGEHFGVNPRDVELWMGTLSKSLSSCGGYIAGSKAMVEYLKYNVGGFVYSVGISPPNAASALASLRKLKAHPELVTQLHERSRFFLELCRERGIDTGMSSGSAVVPCIVGNSYDCLQLSQALGKRGINVQPILYPAVEDHLSRLRFFITSRHSEAQLRLTADAIAEELTKLNPEYLRRKSATGAKHVNGHLNGTSLERPAV